MKRLFTLLSLTFVYVSGFNQVCPSVVSTDPRNPSNPDRPELENQFFWFPHDGNDHNSFEIQTAANTYPYVNSPFWNFSNQLPVGQLAKEHLSDFYPEDGWELVKVNFGKLNDGTQRSTLPSMPYMMLYNRYTGTLRVLGMLPNATTYWQIIKFTLSLPNFLLTQSTTPLDATNLLSIQGNSMQPLDQETDEAVMEVIAEFPGISAVSYFFWFDVPVAYDPCVCYNDVALNIEAEVLQTWNINIQGTLNGELVQQGTPQGDHSKLVAKRIINAAAATATAIATKGAIVQTSAFADLIDIFSQRPGVDQSTQEGLGLLQSAITTTGTVFWEPGTSSWQDSEGNEMKKEDWQKLFMGLGSFVNTGVSFASLNTTNNKPRTTIVGSITASGTATQTGPAGDNIYLGVPGTEWTNTLDETPTSTLSGWIPEYPLYNNPLGTFALLETPKVEVIYSRGHVACDKYTPPSSTQPGGLEIVDANGNPIVPYTTMTCHDLDISFVQAKLSTPELKYYFNPILNLDEEKTEILASLVFRKKNIPFVDHTYCLDWIDRFDSGDAYNFCLECCGEGADILRERLKGLNIISGVDLNERYTPPVPIDYINDIITEVAFEHFSIGESGYVLYLRLFVNFESFDFGSGMDTEPPTPKPVTNSQVFTYPVDIIEVSQPFEIPIVDLLNGGIGEELGGPAFQDQVEGENFNYGSILISGSLASSTQESAVVESSSVIRMVPGAHIQRNLNLRIGYPLAATYPQSEVTGAYVHQFCTNQLPDLVYQANTFSTRALEEVASVQEYFTSQRKTQVIPDVKVFPNPSKGVFNISSTNANLNGIRVFDSFGREVHTQNFFAKSKEHMVDLSLLPSGMYVVSIHVGSSFERLRIVIQH